MDALIQAIQDVVIAEPETEAQPDPTQADDGAVEIQLTNQISSLWSENTRLNADRRTTAKDLREIRTILAERLYEMKSLLSRPGRGGQWRSWLKERGINRSSADRLVAHHGETLCNHEEDAPHEATSNSQADTAEKLARDVWSRLRKVLDTHETVVRFLASIAEISGVSHEWRKEGLMLFNPVPKATDELPTTAIASESTCPAPQPPGGDANSADAPAEVAAGTPATEQVAGVGEDHAEAVA
jgi:hypothetical protein